MPLPAVGMTVWFFNNSAEYTQFEPKAAIIVKVYAPGGNTTPSSPCDLFVMGETVGGTGSLVPKTKIAPGVRQSPDPVPYPYFRFPEFV